MSSTATDFHQWLDSYKPGGAFDRGDMAACWYAAQRALRSAERRTYSDGLQDAHDYIAGSTFALKDAPVVESVLALLRSFHQQGGHGKYPPTSSERATKRSPESIERIYQEAYEVAMRETQGEVIDSHKAAIMNVYEAGGREASALSATSPTKEPKGLPPYPLEHAAGCKWPGCDCPGRWDCAATGGASG